jgi:hypothetical protein
VVILAIALARDRTTHAKPRSERSFLIVPYKLEFRDFGALTVRRAVVGLSVAARGVLAV